MTTARVVLFGLMLSLASTGSAQLDRTQQPEAGRTPPLRLPVLQRSSLENGLMIVLVEHHELPVVQFRLLLQSGSVNDPPGSAGLAALTAAMLDEGTPTRDALRIADDIEFLGASLSISAGVDATTGSLLTLREHMDGAMEVFADVLLNPSFPDAEWERVQKEHLTGLMQQRDRPGTVASKVFSLLTYGEDHPYGRPGDGTEQSVSGITVDAMKGFYADHYRANNATMIVVGDVTMDEVTDLLSTHLGGWRRGSVPSLRAGDAPAIGSTGIYLIDKPEAAQSEIRIGHVGVARDNADYFPLVVMNTILGGQFSSRINLNLRETKGYTYGARSGFSMRKERGPFIASAAVKSAVTDSSVIEFMKELSLIREEPVSEKEIEFARSSLVRREPRNFETPQQIAGQVEDLVLYGLPDDYFETYVQNLQKVTIDDVQRVAREYIHPSGMNIVIVGDVAETKRGLDDLGYGGVVILDDEGRRAN